MLTTLEARSLIDQIGLSLAEKMNREVEEGDLMKLMEQYREDKEEQTNIAIDYPKEMLDEDDLRKLRNLLKSKEPLIKKALGINTLEVEVKEDRVCFAWFERKPEHDELMIYARFIKKLIEKAKDAALHLFSSGGGSKENLPSASLDKALFENGILSLSFLVERLYTCFPGTIASFPEYSPLKSMNKNFEFFLKAALS